jgi:hypothetical protein
MLVTSNSIYLHTPKTGGMWMKYVLEPVTVQSIEHHILQEMPSHTNVFSFVRNPWDWYVSIYLFLIDGSEKFKKTYPIKPPLIQALPDQTFTSFVSALTRSDKEFKKKAYHVYKILKQIKPAGETYLHQAIDPEGVLLSRWMEDSSSYYKIICDAYVKPAFRVGMYEHLRHHLKEMLTICNDDTDEVVKRLLFSDRINVTTNKQDYRQYYNDETERLVAMTSKDIIDQYGYKF